MIDMFTYQVGDKKKTPYVGILFYLNKYWRKNDWLRQVKGKSLELIM
jgi:hypothetical protein